MTAVPTPEPARLNLRYALELAIANELNMAELYGELGRRSQEDDLTRLWKGMAAAEGRHADALERIRADLPAELLETEVEFSLLPLDDFARQLDELREELRARQLSRDELLGSVLRLELAEQNGVLLELLSACPTGLTAELEREVAAPSDRHLHGLLVAIDRFGQDEGLRAQARALGAGGRI